MPVSNCRQGRRRTDGRENSDPGPGATRTVEVQELTPPEPWEASHGPFAQTDCSPKSWTHFHTLLPCTVVLVNVLVQLVCPAVVQKAPWASAQSNPGDAFWLRDTYDLLYPSQGEADGPSTGQGLAARFLLGVSEGCLQGSLMITDEGQGPSDQDVPRPALQYVVQGAAPRHCAPVHTPSPHSWGGTVQAPGHTGQAGACLLGNDRSPALRPRAPFPVVSSRVAASHGAENRTVHPHTEASPALGKVNRGLLRLSEMWAPNRIRVTGPFESKTKATNSFTKTCNTWGVGGTS